MYLSFVATTSPGRLLHRCHEIPQRLTVFSQHERTQNLDASICILFRLFGEFDPGFRPRLFLRHQQLQAL